MLHGIGSSRGASTRRRTRAAEAMVLSVLAQCILIGFQTLLVWVAFLDHVPDSGGAYRSVVLFQCSESVLEWPGERADDRFAQTLTCRNRSCRKVRRRFPSV